MYKIIKHDTQSFHETLVFARTFSKNYGKPLLQLIAPF